MDESKELEQAAIDLWGTYGRFLPSKVKGFMLRLADFLNWQDLKGVMRG
ncbi:MAG TPA: hypothetical protein VJ698_15780 [Noviherbaspirillum sp.]|nr:hypothetical protein [Noviherbaspirillum sp.]HJV86926.1 hypothetical protein [Noviherbaspirillum sp.]